MDDYEKQLLIEINDTAKRLADAMERVAWVLEEVFPSPEVTFPTAKLAPSQPVAECWQTQRGLPSCEKTAKKSPPGSAFESENPHTQFPKVEPL